MGYWQELRGQRRFFLIWVWVCAVMLIITSISAWLNLSRSLDVAESLHKSQLAQREAEIQLESFQLGQDSLPPVFHMENLMALTPLQSIKSMEQGKQILLRAQGALQAILELRKNHAMTLSSRRQAWDNLRLSAENLVQTSSQNSPDLHSAQGVLLAGKSLLDWIQISSQSAWLLEAESPYMRHLLTQADSLLAKHAPQGLDTSWENFVDALRNELQMELQFAEQKRQTMLLLSSLSMAIHHGSLRLEQRSRWAGNIYTAITLALVILILVGVQQMVHNRHLNAMTSTTPAQATQAELHSIQERIGTLLSQVDKAWLESRQDLKQMQSAVQHTQDMENQVVQIQEEVEQQWRSSLEQIQFLREELETVLKSIPPESQSRVAQILQNLKSLELQERRNGEKIEQELEVLGAEGVSLYKELQEIRRSLVRLVGGTARLVKSGTDLEEQGQNLTKMD